MALTKQTARKTSGGKPLAMGRGRAKNPKADPKSGGKADKKVVIEYSSDESFDKDKSQLVEGSGAPKRVKRQIYLTLPTSPNHVTTTETFDIFFINQGLTKDLRKAFEKRGWTSDQLQELMTNFQRKHGKKVPLPKIYVDKDSSDSEGMELQDGTTVGRKMPGRGSGGSKLGRKPSAGGSGGGGAGGPNGGARGSREVLVAVVALVTVQAAVVQADPEEVVVTQEGAENVAVMMTTLMMRILTSEESPASLASLQDS